MAPASFLIAVITASSWLTCDRASQSSLAERKKAAVGNEKGSQPQPPRPSTLQREPPLHQRHATPSNIGARNLPSAQQSTNERGEAYLLRRPLEHAQFILSHVARLTQSFGMNGIIDACAPSFPRDSTEIAPPLRGHPYALGFSCPRSGHGLLPCPAAPGPCGRPRPQKRIWCALLQISLGPF